MAIDESAAPAATPDGPNGPGRSPGLPRGHERLIREIRETTEQLSSADAARGDLKILSQALRELATAFNMFRPYRRRRKATIFGSARTPSDDPTYRQAADFARRLAGDGWMVITGAASGIMEAGHRGAGLDHSLGVNIMLPFEQDANPIIAGDPKLVSMKYFFTRKLLFVKECHAVCLLPGGFGTLDEGFELLTLLQTGKRDMIPVVMLDAPGGDYWKSLQDFVDRHLRDGGMISPEDRSLYLITDDLTEATEEIYRFYRRYHSMRYVGSQLVLRLHSPLSENQLESIQDDFADVLAGGDFRQQPAHRAEADEPELADLPRLAFRYNRRSPGRLRQLIDFLNQTADDDHDESSTSGG